MKHPLSYRQTTPISFWWQKRPTSLRQSPSQPGLSEKPEAGSEPFWAEARWDECCACLRSGSAGSGLKAAESTQRMTDYCASRLDNLGNGQVLATSRAPIGKYLTDRPVMTKVQVLERPYTTSYFLSVKLESKPMQYLIDTGWTINLLSKQVFNWLPERIKGYLEESGSHGIMTDGTQLPLYDVLRLPLRVQCVKRKQFSPWVILGMPILVAHNCSMKFNQPIVQVDRKWLKCTNRHGWLLVSNVQVNCDLVLLYTDKQATNFFLVAYRVALQPLSYLCRLPTYHLVRTMAHLLIM